MFGIKFKTVYHYLNDFYKVELDKAVCFMIPGFQLSYEPF